MQLVFVSLLYVIKESLFERTKNLCAIHFEKTSGEGRGGGEGGAATKLWITIVNNDNLQNDDEISSIRNAINGRFSRVVGRYSFTFQKERRREREGLEASIASSAILGRFSTRKNGNKDGGIFLFIFILKKKKKKKTVLK